MLIKTKKFFDLQVAPVFTYFAVFPQTFFLFFFFLLYFSPLKRISGSSSGLEIRAVQARFA